MGSIVRSPLAFPVGSGQILLAPRASLVVIALLALIAAGCSASPTALPPTPTQTASPTMTSPPPCIARAAFSAHVANVEKDLNDMLAADSADVEAITTSLRLAASEMRTLADGLAGAKPDAEKHFLRAADALDKAAEAASIFDETNLASWLKVATNELSQGNDLIGSADFC